MDTIQTITQSSLSNKITGILEKHPVILQLMRFGAIGVFNTAVDVLVLNFMASEFGITKGAGLGWVNLPGFVLAVIQSYFWNKYWAFGSEVVSLFKNFIRLFSVGVVGVLVYGFVVLGAHSSARPAYFFGIFAVFILAQLVLWNSFGFFKQHNEEQGAKYASFFTVSLIGFLLNSVTLYFVATFFVLSTNSGDNLNLGKILAICVSLVWNFIGYKIFVFKK